MPLVFKRGSHFVTQAGLELSILLLLPPKCWDYGMIHHAWPQMKCLDSKF
jgi:transposase